MEEFDISERMRGHLDFTAEKVRVFLEPKLRRLQHDWWEDCVLAALEGLDGLVENVENYSELSQLNLSELLTVLSYNWTDLCYITFLRMGQKSVTTRIRKINKRWTTEASTLPTKDVILSDLDELVSFCKMIGSKEEDLDDFSDTKKQVEDTPSSNYSNNTVDFSSDVTLPGDGGGRRIEIGTVVHLVANPGIHGVVTGIAHIPADNANTFTEIVKYKVFIDGKERSFYEDQIEADNPSDMRLATIPQLLNLMTAYQINNPKNLNLYSLNTARIDFIPYQFRPVLKLLHADVPRLLIADSVGVGKTIEAGLIIKELEARGDLNSVLVICPKPLVGEHKWEDEMRRFDEELIPMDGPTFRGVISNAHKHGVWPEKYNKIIVPYSILDGRAYEEKHDKKGKRTFCLQDLENPPQFDLVIVDEAHHIRNGSMEKEKAFEYKCVKYFCDAAKAVVMLTATPIQTSNDDLYTLLNVLRSDIVLNREAFSIMAGPNAFVSKAESLVRKHEDGWQENAMEELKNATKTQWGEDVVMSNPTYYDVVETLKKDKVTRTERVKLQGDIESLNSFYGLMSRTRRKDIQDFCKRNSETVPVKFTSEQRKFYDALLDFESAALLKIHGKPQFISFLTSTLRRRAASCVYGVAPYVEDLIRRRRLQIDYEELDSYDEDDLEKINHDEAAWGVLEGLAQDLLDKARNLPEEDPKLDAVLKLIEEKQNFDNNKIMIFSTFRNTLNYLYRHIKAAGYRVEMITGSTKEEERVELRERFMGDKADKDTVDIMLFSEVGSEGLDYQFCSMMINYDLPWNPMKIEQRIGRIDRKGQVSEKVNIYNIITLETIDADIYYRCLARIGIFENNVGGCDIILGDISDNIISDITLGITEIAMNEKLTEEERQEKLEQLADNEIARIKASEELENSEGDFFGIDTNEFVTASQISAAENTWITPENLRILVDAYLSDTLGEGQYIFGDREPKYLRLTLEARAKILKDYKEITMHSNNATALWNAYLAGSNQRNFSLTFDGESARSNPGAAYINVTHPLVIQAARHFTSNGEVCVQARVKSDSVAPGRYYFSIYSWEYVGYKPKTMLKIICQNDDITENFAQIMSEASTYDGYIEMDQDVWDSLEIKQYTELQTEMQNFMNTVYNVSRYRSENLKTNHQNKTRYLEQRISSSTNEKIRRMYEAEIKNDEIKFQQKMAKITEAEQHSDIHSDLFARGIIEVEE